MDDQSSPYIAPPTLPDAAPTYPELPPEPEGSWLARNRKSAILGAIAVLLGGAIAVSALIKHLPTRSAGVNTTNQSTPTQTNTSVTNTASSRPTFKRYVATTAPDQDHDGLTDAEEHQLGTNPNVADTDGDGLSDYDEVKIYQTNPLKKDTDGDGVSDGQEVKNGTNPNGPGPLLNTNQAIQQLKNTNQ